MEADLLARGCAADRIVGTYKSASVYGYCTPAASEENTEFVETSQESVLNSAQWTQTISSMERAWPVILGASLVAVVVGFGYLLSLKWIAAPITWCAVIMIEVLLVAGGAFMLTHANTVPDKSGPTYQFSFYGGIALFVLAALYLCLVLVLYKRIVIALEMVKYASSLLYDTPYVAVMPVFMILGAFVITVLWVLTAVYLYSTGALVKQDDSQVPDGAQYDFQLNNDTRYALLYHLFGFFWSTQFLIALTEITISFVVVRWFFAERSLERNNDKVLPPWPVWSAFQTVCKFHLGSVAFGSLIIAIIK